MRLGRLGKIIQPIREGAEAACRAGELDAHEERRVLNELLSLLTLAETPGRSLSSFCRARRGLRSSLAELAEASGLTYRLPQALYAFYLKGLPRHAVRKRYREVQVSDWKLVHGLARSLGRDLSDELARLAARRGGPPDWMVRAEAEFEEIEIHVEPAALEAMILSVYETYKVPRAGRGSGFTETYGVCFGTNSVRTEARRGQGTVQVVTIHLQRAVPQMRARATADSVAPNFDSTALFLEVGRQLFRHCEIVGEFHSHPYKDLAELKRAGGWNHSQEDQQYVRAQLDTWKRLRQTPRVFLICAVARGKSAAHDRIASRKPNLFALHLSACRFYLVAYRILPNGDLTEQGVTIHCCGNLNGRHPAPSRSRAGRASRQAQ